MNNVKKNTILYIVEVYIKNEPLYMYTKRVALHFPDLAKKFVHKRSANRYFNDSEFNRLNCQYKILKYDKVNDRIIVDKQTKKL